MTSSAVACAFCKCRASAEARLEESRLHAWSLPGSCHCRYDAARLSACAAQGRGGHPLRTARRSFLCAVRCEVPLGREHCGGRRQETRRGKRSRRHTFEKPCSPNFVQMEGASSGKTFQSGLQLSMQLRSSAGPLLCYHTVSFRGRWGLGGTRM